MSAQGFSDSVEEKEEERWHTDLTSSSSSADNSGGGSDIASTATGSHMAPVLAIPGYTFPVDVYYRSDYEELIYSSGSSSESADALAGTRAHAYRFFCELS